MRYLIVDGNHLAARCHHTIGELATSDGRKSGVIHGFLRGLSYVKNKLALDLDSVIVCWDGGRSAWRLELYPDYKAGRKWDQELTPEEQLEKQAYVNQLCALYDGLGFLGIKQIKVKGVEADDLISMISTFYLSSTALNSIIVYSGDHDLYQLITSDRTTLWDPKREQITQADLKANLGFDPYLIPIYKAICGDSSDNIPGVKGVGDVGCKVALRYLADNTISSGSFDDVIDSLPGKEQRPLRLIKQQIDLVVRNLFLVWLPRDFECDQYTADQSAGIIAQLLNQCNRRQVEFVKFLKTWELDDALEHIGRW